MDTAIIDTRLITLSRGGPGIVEEGAVAVEDETIVFVGKTDELDLADVDRIIDGEGHITMPGLVNAHTHTGLTLLRGGAQDVPEIEWMKKALRPLAEHMEREDRIMGSKLGVIEGIRTGTTTFAEYQADVSRTVEEVYEPFNVRVAATETINEVASSEGEIYGLDRKKGERAVKKADELFERYKDSELVDCYYGPQALDMVTLEALRTVHNKAEDRGSMIHMHVAQGEREQKQIEGRFGEGASTVYILEENDMLNSDLIAAHCHGASDDEKRAMMERGVKMVGCPSSIAMIDGIVPPIGDFLGYGGDVGLGTDQAPGPGTHNMLREMRTASLLTKVRDRDPTALPCWEVLRSGCIGGAECLGMGDKIGSLEPGKKADLITIDLSRVNLTPTVSTPFHNFIPNLIYSSTGCEVDNVMVNGEMIMENGDLVNVDERGIIQESERRAREIFSQAEDDWRAAGSYLVEKKDDGAI